MADKKTFVVVLQSEDVSRSEALASRGPKSLRVAGETIAITAEGYKITNAGDVVFVAPHHQVRYIQEEKSLCDNAATGAQTADLRDVIGKAENEGLIKDKLTTAAIPRFTSLQEMAKEFHSSQPQVGSTTATQVLAINSFIEFLENRLRSTLLPRR